MKTVLLTSIARDGLHRALTHFGDVSVAADHDDALRSMDGADALVLSNPGLYTEAFAQGLADGAGSLRWIQFLAAGYDGPMSHGVPAGTVFANAGDAWSPTVAEHAVMLLLTLLRRVPDCMRAQADRRWDGDIRPRLRSLEGATVTILGFGSIGRELAIRLKPFGTRIIGINRSGRTSTGIPVDRMAPIARLHDCLRESDGLVVAVPLSEETRNIVDRNAIAKMRPDAVVVNVSRGGTLDGIALAEALSEGRLAGASLDVTEPEPLPEAHPLWAAPNIIITPHIAGFGSPALDLRLIDLVAENAERFVTGRDLLHRVDVPVRN